MREWPEPGLMIACVVGFGVGAVTVWMVGELYPPAHNHLTPMATVATLSIVAILILYFVSAGLDVRQAGDWLIIGYVVALVLAASFAVGREMMWIVRDHVPENVGMKTTAATVVHRRA
jgi:hypothetical protein